MSVLRCAYGTRVSATREGAERIDESCELRVSWSRCFYFTVVPQRADLHSNIRFGASPAAPRHRAPRHRVRRTSRITDHSNRLKVIAQFSCKILPFFPHALRLAAARP
jgi:hypothetical protein